MNAPMIERTTKMAANRSHFPVDVISAGRTGIYKKGL